MRRIIPYLMAVVVVVAALSASQPGNSSPTEANQTDTIHISVVVRAPGGDPVTDLVADDFIVEEAGQRYPVEITQHITKHDLQLRGQTSTPASLNTDVTTPNSGPLLPNRNATERTKTHMLLIIPPMHPGTRSALLKSAIEHMQFAAEYGWDVALFDPSGNFTPFTHDIDSIVAALKKLKTQADKPLYSQGWFISARRHIRELAPLPGRHLVVMASDTEIEELDRDSTSVMSARLNPNLLRVDAATFEPDARTAMAQLYLIQASGPGVVIPFGGAGSSGTVDDAANPGPEITDQVVSEDMYHGGQRSRLMGAANNTGGRLELDMGDALKDAQKDAAGYYELAFHPDPIMLDGHYHPIKVTVRNKQLRVFVSPYYYAPQAIRTLRATAVIPRDLKQALDVTNSVRGFGMKPMAWYFPDRSNGIATVPLAAELSIPKTASGSSQTNTTARFAAGIFDERLGGYIGTWNGDLTWSDRDSSGKPSAVEHALWQHTVHLPPGSYQLRAAAIQPGTNATVSAAWRFLIHSPNPTGGLAVSSILLARDCLSKEQSSERQDLLDPLAVNNCRLQPLATPAFVEGEQLLALLRIYTGNTRIKDFPDKWHASVSIFSPQDGKPQSFFFPIERASGPGWTVLAELPLNQLGLSPGEYQLRIDVTGPKKQAFAKQARFEVRAQ
jgi:VWFA-related protein